MPEYEIFYHTGEHYGPLASLSEARRVASMILRYDNPFVDICLRINLSDSPMWRLIERVQLWAAS